MREGMITQAIGFAEEAHEGQVRKYTGEPYYTHPLAVAKIVHEHVVDHTQEMLVAAVLHDTVEDTNTTLKDIEQLFGHVVANYVYFLSDVSKPEDGNRAHRKAMDRAHIARAPEEAKTIKLADLIHNTANITVYDEKFAKVYMAEKVLLLEVLKDGDAALYKMETEQVEAYYAS